MSTTRKAPLLRRLRRFGRTRRAVAIIEFTLIAPFMLSLFFGAVEVGQLLTIDRKTSQTARAIADLSSQLRTPQPSDATKTVPGCWNTAAPTPEEAKIAGLLDVTDAVISPYSAAELKVVVSCLAVDKTGIATVKWSRARRGSERAPGSTVAVPTGLADTTKTTYWLMGETTYVYTPTIGYVLTGSFNLEDKVYMRSRS
ncbi:TadE/TadG family type IV pilus assembly protein [Blastochloris sulfoviridis]|uniref:TadE-like domain-containing protein n=1 Tax=Blastochloris sulfoviridis TaxID=50712 RepID=A0A5M6I5H2_9HYPH|nr:TadE/TadG family type IV pilus assembly protein [Blastochloris sulfoviridis]KAA5603413.1 hypothetical protein F1193_01840 [Blastochloris sulfoviridis]